MKNPAKSFPGVILLAICFAATSQDAIFLHHSTGSGVYVEGKVAAWITDYNTAHGTNHQVTDRLYPDTPYPWNNYPYDYWNLWINGECDNADEDIECLGSLCGAYDVIIYKHCFPGSAILADDESPSVSSSKKTLANYKLQYRALRDLMDSYPNNKFIVWTLAPLHRLATNAESAARARQFVEWVKSEWLTEDGREHPNIFIFDFYSYVVESDPDPEIGVYNCLKYEYEYLHDVDDSHPNRTANRYVGPFFAQFIVDVIEGDNAVKVTGITVSGATTITSQGGTAQMSASVVPDNASNKAVTWSIQNGTGEATISTSGLVTAIANGTVSAKATANDGSGISGILNLEIGEQVPTGIGQHGEVPFVVRTDGTEIHIEFTNTAIYDQIRFYDLRGNLLLTEKLSDTPYKVNISALPSGMYIMQLVSRDGKAEAVKVRL